MKSNLTICAGVPGLLLRRFPRLIVEFLVARHDRLLGFLQQLLDAFCQVVLSRVFKPLSNGLPSPSCFVPVLLHPSNE